MRFKKILVPVDFSEYSNRAAEYALLWGDEFGADITLVHVNTLFHKHFDYDTFADEYLKNTEAQEKHVQQWLQEHHLKIKEGTLDFELLNGPSAAHEILRFLSTHDFDLVVMGTHGRRGAKHFFLGSVAERVSRLSPVPVLTIHHSMENFDIKNVLVPIDFSDYSRPLIEEALTLAKAFDARIHLLHVFEHPGAEAFEWLTNEEKILVEMDRELKALTTKRLEAYLSDVQKTAATVSVVKSSHAYEQIVDYAKGNEMDLIVMATRGFNKFEYFWSFGSTTERVVRLASCPVLAIRQEVVKEMQQIT